MSSAINSTMPASKPAARLLSFSVERWTRASVTSVVLVVCAQLLLALAPLFLSAGAVDRLTTLFIYAILALMWNALAGYAGLVSVGHQAFFGLGAYATVRLADAGLAPYAAMLCASVLVAMLAIPISAFMLRLKGGEFAIGMWVFAALCHLLVNLDGLVQGETGTSLISLQQFDVNQRRLATFWAALGTMAVLGWLVYALLRSRVGTALQAIRDSEEAALSVGVKVNETKRLIFAISAFGCAAAGALWLATAITFQPKTYFSVQWTAYMLFMVLVGGIGTYEGPIVGAVLFFSVETIFGATGVYYLIGLGAVAVAFALFAPQGIWGAVERRTGLHLLPVGWRLRSPIERKKPDGARDAGKETQFQQL